MSAVTFICGFVQVRAVPYSVAFAFSLQHVPAELFRDSSSVTVFCSPCKFAIGCYTHIFRSDRRSFGMFLVIDADIFAVGTASIVRLMQIYLQSGWLVLYDLLLEDTMATDRESSAGVSSSTAVLVGALSSGVNGPTWFVLKIIFLMLGISLAAMLVLAFSSSDIIIAGHIILLVIITGVLFMLLSSFLAQTGLVSVEQQMDQMGISQKKKKKAEEKGN